ncbi:MAG: LysR family transcriptional regulator [Sulfobacillus sp.]
MNMVTSLDRYRIFHAVAEAGSLTQAAEDLFVSQPAVSQSIKKLENEIGAALLIRTARGIQLTSAGVVLLSYVDQALQLLEAGERHVADLRQLNRGDIRIGASDTLCRHYLLPILDSFHREHPHIQLHVTNRTSRETVTLLQAGQIDFGIVNLPVSNERLTIFEGPRLQDCFVVGDKYRELANRPLALAELSRVPLLLLETGSVTRAQIDEFFVANGVSLTPEIELGSIDLLVEFARIGLGVSAVIRNFVQDDLTRGRLYEVQTVPPMPSRSVGLIVSKEVPMSYAAMQLMTQLRATRLDD